MAARLDGYQCKLAITRERQRFSKIHESNRDIFTWRSCSCLRCGVEVNTVPGDRMNEWTRVLWNTYPVHCCCMKLCETQLIAAWRRLQVRQNTYFCTVDNGDCIVYNQASMNMDLLNLLHRVLHEHSQSANIHTTSQEEMWHGLH